MKASKRHVDVTKGSISRHMYKLAIPSIGGMLAITIFNLTDTYFVSKLGTQYLAAMGFTFPVVMIIGAFSSGISIGAGSLVARAIGRKDFEKTHRIASDGILLAILSVVIVAGIGLLTMDPLFTALGADAQTLPLVKSYMIIWYSGVAVVVMPPVSDATMRAIGDMIRPSLVMMTCAVVNLILDPILIFGWFGLPAMGIQGAAIATLISRFAGMCLSLGFVHFKYKMLHFKYQSIRQLLKSWSEIVVIGIPSALVRLFPQLIRALVTKLAAVVGGFYAVAAIAAGTKIESFATVISMAVGVAIVPLIGQNWGAHNGERVNDVRRLINKIAVIYGIVLFGLSLIFAEPLARIFDKTPEVVEYIKLYLWIILIGTIGLNLYNWTSEMMNAAGKPRWTLQINILGTIFVLIPLVLLGAWLGQYTGMLLGLVVGQLIVGVYAVLVGKNALKLT